MKRVTVVCLAALTAALGRCAEDPCVASLEENTCPECRNGATQLFTELCKTRSDTTLSPNDCGGRTVAMGPYAGAVAHYDRNDRLIGFKTFSDVTDDQGCFARTYGEQCKSLEVDVQSCPGAAQSH